MEDVHVEVVDEEAKSAAYTIEVLTKAGLDPEAAGFLAGLGVDRWKAKRMVEAGCSTHLILEILT